MQRNAKALRKQIQESGYLTAETIDVQALPGKHRGIGWWVLRIVGALMLIAAIGLGIAAWKLHQAKSAYEDFAALQPQVMAQYKQVKAEILRSISCNKNVSCLLLAANASHTAQGTYVSGELLRLAGANNAQRRPVSEKALSLGRDEQNGEIYKTLKRVEASCESPFTRCPLPGRRKLSLELDFLVAQSNKDVAALVAVKK